MLQLFGLIFLAAVAVLCFSEPDAGRLFFGSFYLATTIGVNINLFPVLK